MSALFSNGEMVGGSVENTDFTSSDVADGQATSWTTVTPIVDDEPNVSLFTKLSQMFKNVRWLKNKLDASETYESFNVTPSTGITATNQRSYKNGKVVNINVGFQGITPSAVEGGTVIIGTIPSAYRPSINAYAPINFGAFSGTVTIFTGGELHLQTFSIGANTLSYVTFSATYLVK